MVCDAHNDGFVLCDRHNKGFIQQSGEGAGFWVGVQQSKESGMQLPRWFSFTWQFGFGRFLAGSGSLYISRSFIPTSFIKS